MPAPASSAARMQFGTTLQRIAEFDPAGYSCFIHTPYVPPAAHTLWDEFKRAWQVFRASRHYKAILLNSQSGVVHPDMLAIALIAIFHRKHRPAIALEGAMWQPNYGVRGLFERALVWLADGVIDRYIVHSSEELQEFARLWNIRPDKLRCCLYFYSITQEEIARPMTLSGNYIFAGGNSHRNYDPLLEAAREFPDQPFNFATHLLDGRADLPPNVHTNSVSHTEFIDLMKCAAIVVVPMMSGLHRAAGQQTYLNAMVLGKPVVVSDGFGVRDHIENGHTGLVVDGSRESYVRALRWLLDPQNRNAVDQMASNAQEVVRTRFSREGHVLRLIQLMKELLEETDDRGPAPA